MNAIPDFPITAQGIYSTAFRKNNIFQFKDACNFVAELKYRRNEVKTDPLAVINELQGTCSTKHALLKRLSDENLHAELKLYVGIFEMNENNPPIVSNVPKVKRS